MATKDKKGAPEKGGGKKQKKGGGEAHARGPHAGRTFPRRHRGCAACTRSRFGRS